MADVLLQAAAKPAIKKKDSSRNPVQQPVKDTSTLLKAQMVLEELPDVVQGLLRPRYFLLMNYLKGIAYALGVMTAFAVVIPLMVWVLRSLPWGPMMDGVIQHVIQRVEEARTR